MWCQVEKQIDNSQRIVRLTVHASHQFMVEKEGRERRWINWKIAYWTVLLALLWMTLFVVVVVVVCLFVCFLSGMKMYQARYNRTSAVNIQQASCGWRAHKWERTFLTWKKRIFKTGIWLFEIYYFDANIQPVVIGCCGRGDQKLSAVSACCFSMMDRENGTLRLSPCVKDRENICHPVWKTEKTPITDLVWRTEKTPITLCEGQREHLSLTLCER